jgi:hypothetical protein
MESGKHPCGTRYDKRRNIARHRRGHPKRHAAEYAEARSANMLATPRGMPVASCVATPW